MILKTPSNKDFRCTMKDRKMAKTIIDIMRTCFTPRELRTDIILTKRPLDKCGECVAWVSKTNRLCEVELTIEDFTPITIVHELVHASRYLKYGHKDARCHDEESVEAEAVRRVRRIKG